MSIEKLYQAPETVLNPSNDRRELQRRLEQTRRIVSQITDPLVVGNLKKLAVEIEDELRRAESGDEDGSAG